MTILNQARVDWDVISFKISKTLDLRPLSARLAGIPKISIHSLQEHCLLV